VSDRDEIGSREARIARNELLFRTVNERIGELGRYWDSPLEIVCECGDPTCHEPIEIPPESVETLATDRVHFFVVPGHEIPDVEEVVERHGAYFVVEKPKHAETLAEGG